MVAGLGGAAAGVDAVAGRPDQRHAHIGGFVAVYGSGYGQQPPCSDGFQSLRDVYVSGRRDYFQPVLRAD